MSATAEEPDPTAADQAYFRTIEELFVRRRGAPLLLSPADWQTAQRWRRAGVPLELVLRTVEELFDRRAQRRKPRRVNSLRYFAAAVDAAWDELQALIAPGRGAPPPPLDVAARLAALAAALPADLAGREAWGELLRGLGGETEAVEAALARLDDELVESERAALSEELRRDIEAGAARTLAALAERLPADEVAAARQRLERQLLRRRRGLPVLSLFSPEALAGDAAAASAS
jgi:hypothetical protein